MYLLPIHADVLLQAVAHRIATMQPDEPARNTYRRQVRPLKIGIFSHCAIDTIVVDGGEFERAGGAACYCGLTARAFGADVRLATKFGSDFPASTYLKDKKMRFADALSDMPTTRFRIEISGAERQMYLEHACEPVQYQGLDADGTIVTPIFREIMADTFERIKKDSGFTLLDPQGFLRRADESGMVRLEKTNVDLKGVSALKVEVDGMGCLADGSGTDSMKELRDRGVKYVLHTDGPDISVLAGERLYSLRLPNKEIHDTTGVGDIFCSAFLCTMLREKDFLWAFCFATGAAQAALDTHGLGLDKVPAKGRIEINASYFYNTVKFRQV